MGNKILLSLSKFSVASLTVCQVLYFEILSGGKKWVECIISHNIFNMW